jgi:hypothetical protein
MERQSTVRILFSQWGWMMNLGWWRGGTNGQRGGLASGDVVDVAPLWSAIA